MTNVHCLNWKMYTTHSSMNWNGTSWTPRANCRTWIHWATRNTSTVSQPNRCPRRSLTKSWWRLTRLSPTSSTMKINKSKNRGMSTCATERKLWCSKRHPRVWGWSLPSTIGAARSQSIQTKTYLPSQGRVKWIWWSASMCLSSLMLNGILYRM